MIIRSLDNPNDVLSFLQDEQGDVYVTICHHGETSRDSHVLSVRLGGPGSGQSFPPALMKAFHQVASQFELYKDCKNEAEAYAKYTKETKLTQNET